MLNEYSSCETILVRLLLGYAPRNTQMLILVKPQHMEITATFRQFAEEGLDGMYSV
jgi:hypothetical protein